MSIQPGLIFTKPGFLSLLQDGGRRGVMHMGLTTGGAMDRHAWAWANRLLENSYGAPALEITFGGVEFTSNLDTQIAITGAEVQCKVNGDSRPLWSVINLKAGDRVSLTAPKSGIRSYLAVLEGFQLDSGLGDSCASFTREGLGGLHQDGRPLQEGDHLPCQPRVSQVPNRKVPEHWKPDYKEDLVLSVIPGAQIDRFSASVLETFFGSTYTLTPQTDRMGARLKGPALKPAGTGLISEGTSLGAIQVPADGQPILLLNDRQTIGGYPKLGAVTPRSLDALAQRAPGTRLRFRPIALHEAQTEEKRFLGFFSGTGRGR
ncbi:MULTISPECIES: biotin-dependent carboxyltransferase family protein [unclassified Marinobacter]|uniref:5-oxoprolinase subunit C family protein n=1 Tax=unclassified Marinobacter TaxID=83889 RepID=UPI0018F222FB|nr:MULTISPECIES: biotin-dependent carboxyltransferase family protein [unclassified Marinobacter]|tara:strand:+ start:315 stop:1268 length:954 start_codon:yes stop_codon:yes gene_type:complete